MALVERGQYRPFSSHSLYAMPTPVSITESPSSAVSVFIPSEIPKPLYVYPRRSRAFECLPFVVMLFNEGRVYCFIHFLHHYDNDWRRLSVNERRVIKQFSVRKLLINSSVIVLVKYFIFSSSLWSNRKAQVCSAASLSKT